ncbi:cytochrome P450 monooxygenase-like protein [Clohesyomyces aquaticus]|uniref:Cytochrome P450 monooxygenase-like protein n=1 Tax=Clohesyomyces aquaticus TaxID=1231657 RepID=A0A1Y1ZBP6_9PLEO|nr:cytochrome P450 monooxygenase-like protein [Clohesyomyces aquaticus]
MTTFLLLTILLFPTLFILSTLISLLRNYLTARTLHLPIIVLPISPENPLWMLTSPYILPFFRALPFSNGHFTRFCYTGWEFVEKSRAHLEFGDAFVLATPGRNWIYTCDAGVIREVIRRERGGEFARPLEMLSVLETFGANIATVNGADWQRMRKCTAASFNEQNNLLVWTESLRQGNQMLQYWLSAGAEGVKTMAYDTRTLTLDILAHAGFGKSFDFQSRRDRMKSGALSYRDALALILENAILILALGPPVLKKLAWVPGLGILSEAVDKFKRCMTDIFDETTEKTRGQRTQGNFLTSLVRGAVEDKLLTPEEVIGNIFIFSFAGHDTTSHTFEFSFMLLAMHPKVQDWMAEELNYVVKGDRVQEPGYDVFPKLVRVMAVMLETLRLYDPLISVVKGTEGRAAKLKFGEQDIMVPPKTRVIFNINALHSHPQYWGDDALEWKPSRWIQTATGDGPVHDRESITIPTTGLFVPWSEGMRGCPGKKFSQVEYVAVMVILFREYCVAPVKRQGEDDIAAKARAQSALKDTGMRLLLQMLHPEKCPLKWERRV